MNSHLSNLKQRYKDKIYSCKKSKIEIINYIENEYDTDKLDKYPADSINIIECTIYNILNNKTINIMNLEENQLELLVFILRKTENNKKFFSEKDFIDSDILSKRIYIIFETKNMYIYSNNSYIMTSLNVFKGIDSQDIYENNNNFVNYLLSLENLDDMIRRNDFL